MPWINDEWITEEAWGQAVKHGAYQQTMRRLLYHNRIAKIIAKERAAKDIAIAFAIRQKQLDVELRARRNVHIEGVRTLTLEEYGKLYVLNVSTIEAFDFWRKVRCRGRIEISECYRALERINGQESDYQS